MAIEIVDLPSYKMVIFHSYVSSPEGNGSDSSDDTVIQDIRRKQSWLLNVIYCSLQYSHDPESKEVSANSNQHEAALL